MKERFIDRKFSAGSLVIIDHANRIIADYQAQGFTLTLRQLYYQFVSRALIANKQSEYKRLGSIVNDGRLAGLIDWSSIEDRGRNVVPIASWTDPAEIVAAIAKQYREDLWDSQPYRPEVWIEKDALVGVIEGVCDEWRVPFMGCRGYMSQSEVYAAGKRFADQQYHGQIPVVFHLGDHDPSGLDMTRDNADRLQLFARMGVEVVRLALHIEQIRRYDPPPNPAKDTDARFEGYRQEFGDQSWELDALEPSVIADLISDAIRDRIDMDRWEAAAEAENENKIMLERTSRHWPKVQTYLKDLPS